MSKKVRIAVVGVGGIAQSHIHNIKTLDIYDLTAVCDVSEKAAMSVAKTNDCQWFTDHKKLLKSDVCDAVLVATPHFFHVPIGVDVLKANKHLLVEKPIGVHKADSEKLIKAHKNKKLIFAAMFNLRTNPIYKKVKQLIKDGECGQLRRVNWTVTDWFRTQAYYDSGSWRATWKGEGGGVLLNQCPHQLDLLQWLCGMPETVTGFCGIGARHKIEVEDEVTAFLTYKNGATGTFITSTGEYPGTNRLEIAGDRGRLIVENGKIHFTRTEKKVSEVIKKSKNGFDKPEVWEIDIPVTDEGTGHREIVGNFGNAILKGEKIVAPGAEGANSVELGNAILYSSINDKRVDMPLNGKKYEAMLKKLIRESKNK